MLLIVKFLVYIQQKLETALEVNCASSLLENFQFTSSSPLLVLLINFQTTSINSSRTSNKLPVLLIVVYIQQKLVRGTRSGLVDQCCLQLTSSRLALVVLNKPLINFQCFLLSNFQSISSRSYQRSLEVHFEREREREREREEMITNIVQSLVTLIVVYIQQNIVRSARS